MPSPPYQYNKEGEVLDLVEMGKDLAQVEEQRQVAYTDSRNIQRLLVQAKLKLETGLSTADVDRELATKIASIAPDGSGVDRTPREANLSFRMEDYVRYMSFRHFLATGMLLPPSQASYVTDEEYLAGACMGLCQDLSRYGMGRATARDYDSVLQASRLVQRLLDYLLQFDFRNGSLRRKYDGTKYALKNLETILYELSITGCKPVESDNAADIAGTDANPDSMDVEPTAKRRKHELKLPSDELDDIRKRMEARDEMRETLIKKCRDGQKAAKQAIYALHRGDYERASQLIGNCEKCIKTDLLPIVDQEPPLRYGSFSNVLEEYVEAKLFQAWLCGKDVGPSGDVDVASIPSCIILQPTDFVDISVDPDSYLGGLCDLTGEIGRYAVQRGTARDTENVRNCLSANSSIYAAIQSMERTPGVINKKIDQLRRSIEKLERMLYEMSLSEAAGGRPVKSGEHDDADGENGGRNSRD